MLLQLEHDRVVARLDDRGRSIRLHVKQPVVVATGSYSSGDMADGSTRPLCRNAATLRASTGAVECGLDPLAYAARGRATPRRITGWLSRRRNSVIDSARTRLNPLIGQGKQLHCRIPVAPRHLGSELGLDQARREARPADSVGIHGVEMTASSRTTLSAPRIARS